MKEEKDSQGDVDPRLVCFEKPDDERAFSTSLTLAMGALHKQSSQMFVCENNVLRFNHGSRWVHSAREVDEEPAMRTISAEWLIPFKDIAENDLGLIERSMAPVSESMDRQFAQNLYGVVGAAATKVGNVIDAREEGSVAQSFLAMLRKIEFGVDRDGNISMPQMHVSPEMGDRMLKELRNQPPEFELEVEQIKAEKAKAALAREAERKAKFKKAGS